MSSTDGHVVVWPFLFLSMIRFGINGKHQFSMTTHAAIFSFSLRSLISNEIAKEESRNGYTQNIKAP